MKRLYPLLLIFALQSPTWAQETPAPAEPVIVFPPGPTPPTPPPVPTGSTVILPPGQLYVVTASVAVIPLTSPNGVVSFTNDAGPIRVSGIFYGGSGKRETRNYTAKSVVIVEASSSGATELLIVPVGVTAEKQIARQVIQVGDIPPKPPEPPIPPSDPFLTTLQTAFASEPAATRLNDAKQLAALYRAAADPAFIQTVTPATAQGLQTLMHAKAGLPTMVDGRLMTVRRALADESNRVIRVAPGAPLDAALQSQFIAEFNRFATLLEALK